MSEGRPSLFSDEIANKICERIAEGRSLAAICREMEIGYSTVITWLRQNETFQANYARAREDQADADADAINDIASRVIDGTVGHQEARVAIDALKWTAGRRKPKVYGDRASFELTGPNGGPIQTIDPSKLSDAALAELMAAMNAAPQTDGSGSTGG